MAQPLGPAKTGPEAKLWLSQKVEKIGPAKIWEKLARPKFGRANFGFWPSFGLFPNTTNSIEFFSVNLCSLDLT
jgi:hypothetical protein